MPNVVGSGAPCANAVPCSLHMRSSTGSHRETPTPESAPRRACRRENLSFCSNSTLRAPCLDGQCGGGTEGVAGHEISDEIAPDVAARRERLNQLVDLGRVGFIFHAPVHVAIEVAHHAGRRTRVLAQCGTKLRF